MAEELGREALLRWDFMQQTARIRWHELQTYYAHGSVVAVDTGLDLVEAAVQLAMDNTDLFRAWLDTGRVAPVSDSQALAWYEADEILWAVVAAPWVLVQLQPAADDTSATGSP